MKAVVVTALLMTGLVFFNTRSSSRCDFSFGTPNTSGAILSFTNDTIEFESEMNIHFENIENEKIKDCFIRVMRQYGVLHDCEVKLIQGRIKASTMQAQPIIRFSNLFGKTQRYKVRLAHLVKDSRSIEVAKLPEDVLVGWFAHELGHLVDYRPLNNLQMFIFGLKYIFSPQFKSKAEHAADHIAIQNGFRDEIIATKRFILEHDLMDEKYKEIIRRYYMTIEEAEVWEHKHIPMAPEPKL